MRQVVNSSSRIRNASIKVLVKRVNADSPGSYLVKYLTNYCLGGRSCSGSCWFQIWCISTACLAVAERTVYNKPIMIILNESVMQRGLIMRIVVKQWPLVCGALQPVVSRYS